MARKKSGRRKKEKRGRFTIFIPQGVRHLWQKIPKGNRSEWVQNRLKDYFYQHDAYTNKDILREVKRDLGKLQAERDTRIKNLEQVYERRIKALAKEAQRMQEELDADNEMEKIIDATVQEEDE